MSDHLSPQASFALHSALYAVFVGNLEQAMMYLKKSRELCTTEAQLKIRNSFIDGFIKNPNQWLMTAFNGDIEKFKAFLDKELIKLEQPESGC